MIKIAVFDKIARMENKLTTNDLVDYGSSIDPGQRQQGEEHLHHHEPSEAVTVISGVREPEADFLQGDTYPGRNHFERR